MSQISSRCSFAVMSAPCILLMIGWLVRPAALVLATIVLEIALTGGRVDGGLYIIATPPLFAALVYYAWRSGRYGAWSPNRHRERSSAFSSGKPTVDLKPSLCDRRNSATSDHYG